MIFTAYELRDAEIAKELPELKRRLDGLPDDAAVEVGEAIDEDGVYYLWIESHEP